MWRTALQRRPQRLAGSEHLRLADDVIEAARPHPVGERTLRRCV
jgi:hypothetical protein